MAKLDENISQMIWDIKYRYREGDRIIDQTISDTLDRVARAAASGEKDEKKKEWEDKFRGILDHFAFLPGGRILAGAGTRHKVTLFNCFVMNIAEDSLVGIFNALEEGALTLQQGGGIGYDFSILRPKGSLAKATGIPASGPVSFMRIWDTMCSVMLSTGARRGAMMGVLRCDHPDIIEFIEAKRNPNELRHFNVSVMVFDDFMQAVKDDADWALIYPTDNVNDGSVVYRQWGNSFFPVACKIHQKVRARDIWDLIIRSAYDYAEPGVLFGNTINRMNNLWYCERINATNPCGEIPLPSYGACNLGAINLTQFIVDPFTSQAKINFHGIEETAKIATRFLDNIIDISNYPLRQQLEKAYLTRRIGLGITGLADAFVMLGIEYGSQQSITLAKEIMQYLTRATWFTSIALAKEKGKFQLFKQRYCQENWIIVSTYVISFSAKCYGLL